MVMEVPRWCEGIVDGTGADNIEAAVGAAEKRTSAEIVPMIVHRSITVGHVPVILALGWLLIFWSLLPLVAERFPTGVPFWGLQLVALLLALGLAWWLGRYDWVQRWLTSDRDEEMSVMNRAELEFHHFGVRGTAGRNGVLLMVSLVEHRAVVLADQSVAEQFPPETWEVPIRVLITRIKKGDFAGGMVEAMNALAEILAVKFPLSAAGAGGGELANHLVIKE
jgi:putative membrane protein